MAPSIASSSYRLPRRWRRISVTLRGRAARYWTAASYGLPSGLDLELALLTVRALRAHVEASVAHLRFDLRGDVLVLAEELLGVLAALSDALLAVVDPRTGLVEDRGREPHVEKSALARDALVREDLDLGDAERRRDLVLHDLDLHPAADHDDVDRARADEGIGDLERLLAVVRLRDEQVVGVDPAGPRPRRVERVLRVDEGSRAAGSLSGRDRVERERGLARGLRPEDLDDPTAREPPNAERHVHRERASRDAVDLLIGAGAELHDRALPELLLDLLDRLLDRSRLFRHCHFMLLTLPKRAAPACVTPAPPRSPPFSGVLLLPVLFFFALWLHELEGHGLDRLHHAPLLELFLELVLGLLLFVLVLGLASTRRHRSLPLAPPEARGVDRA